MWLISDVYSKWIIDWILMVHQRILIAEFEQHEIELRHYERLRACLNEHTDGVSFSQVKGAGSGFSKSPLEIEITDTVKNQVWYIYQSRSYGVLKRTTRLSIKSIKENEEL